MPRMSTQYVDMDPASGILSQHVRVRLCPSTIELVRMNIKYQRDRWIWPLTMIHLLLACIIFIRRHRRYTELAARMYLDVIRVVLPVSWDRSQV
jgi:hypothetical protein